MTESRLPDHLSVSAVKLADKCSLAWDYRYIKKIPSPVEAAAKMFGTVVHNGLESWYGDEGSDNHKKTQLSSYVHNGWFDQLPMDIGIALRHCIAAERDQASFVQALLLTRPELKSPRTTKAFLQSQEYKRFEGCRDELLAAATKCEDVRWPKDENAFQAYQKSIAIAKQLQDRWERHPRPLVVEKEFIAEFAGVEVWGRIDQIRADPNPDGEVHIEGLDVKTGRRLMTQMDAFLQAFLYNEACYLDPTLPMPEYWTFWMARHNKPQHGQIDRERHGKLAQRILHRVLEQIGSGTPAPHYGMWCDSCDYKSLCEQEISIWTPGADSLVLEAA